VNTVNLADVFVGIANRWRDKPAIVSPDITVSYEELIARAARSARELQRRGIEPGNNVGIAINDSAETLSLMLAVWMIGATAVPLDFREKPAVKKQLADDFHLIAILDSHQPPADAGYATILVDESWRDVIAGQDSRPLFYGGEPGPAVISLTSGTTGKPLGIVLDHERYLLQFMLAFGSGILDPGKRMVSALPLFYPASRNRMLNRLFDGATIHFLPPVFGVDELSEAIWKTEATVVFAVPTLIRGLLKLHENRTTPIFSHVQALISGGAPILPAEKQKTRAVLCRNYLETFGSSFCGSISILYGDDLDTHPASVGRPLANVALQIVDETDEVLPPCKAGSIRVRSPGMARAIYGGTTRTTGDRIKDGWLYTGDIGVMDSDGFLTLLGRSSDLIVRSGVNVHPAEVEAAMSAFPGVREVAVVGYAAEREGEDIAAFVICDAGVTEEKILTYCRTEIAPDKRPRRVVLVSAFPRNATGKVLRTELRQQLEKSSQKI
jgi:long-chain acyl-CoA synthetase